MTAKSLLLLCVLAAFGFRATPAHAARSFDQCQYYVDSVPTTITTPGVWCLRQDLKVPSPMNSAINIQASNTTLDCKGFVLDGTAIPEASAQWGIVSDQQHGVTIRNCTLKGFFTGIAIYNTTSYGNSVRDNRVLQSYGNGIQVVGDGSVVRGNTVLHTVTTQSDVATGGITVWGAVDVIDNLVSDVRAVNTNVSGISVNESDGSIIGNRVRGLGAGVVSFPSVAISVVNDSNVVVRDNDVAGDASPLTYGLFCRGATGVVTRNVIKGMATALSECGLPGHGNDVSN